MPHLYNSRVSGDSSGLGSPPRGLSVASVGDIVSLKLISAQVCINAVSGDMKMLGYFSGHLKIETVSGNVELDTPMLSELHFNSVSCNAASWPVA